MRVKLTAGLVDTPTAPFGIKRTWKTGVLLRNFEPLVKWSSAFLNPLVHAEINSSKTYEGAKLSNVNNSGSPVAEICL